MITFSKRALLESMTLLMFLIALLFFMLHGLQKTSNQQYSDTDLDMCQEDDCTRRNVKLCPKLSTYNTTLGIQYLSYLGHLLPPTPKQHLKNRSAATELEARWK